MTNQMLGYDVGVEDRIQTIRGQKVILDADLARIYGVSTKVFNQAVKRNTKRFPVDFMFQLTPQEVTGLRPQIVILNDPQHTTMQPVGNTNVKGNRSQIVTGSQKHRDPRYRPFAFTEHGAIMAANVLNSPQAVKMKPIGYHVKEALATYRVRRKGRRA